MIAQMALAQAMQSTALAVHMTKRGHREPVLALEEWMKAKRQKGFPCH